MIDDQNKFLFVHIPKTAGSSIVSSLLTIHEIYNDGEKLRNVMGHSHDTALQWKNKTPKWNSYYKFAVVRNPWDRLRSHWNYSNSHDYVISKMTQWEFIKSHRLVSYRDYLFDKDDNLLVDHVYRYEDGMPSILDHLSKKFNVSLPYVHAKQRPYNNEFEFRQDYIDYVLEERSFDFEYFGYDKTLPSHIKAKQ